MTDVRLQVIDSMRITLREIVIVIARPLPDNSVGDCIGLTVRSESMGDEWNTSEFWGFDVKPLVQTDLRRLVFRPVGKARDIDEGEIFTIVAKPVVPSL